MNTKSHPIGYIEVQRSWIGDDTGVMRASMLFDAEVEVVGKNNNYFLTNWHTDKTLDGAGVAHYTMYVGFAPRTPAAEQLNPHNLNDAPVNNIGDPARDNNIGWKEQKF
jgi:hypothetical protein